MVLTLAQQDANQLPLKKYVTFQVRKGMTNAFYEFRNMFALTLTGIAWKLF